MHSLIEKIVFTIIILAHLFSISHLRPRKPDVVRHLFMDLYVLTWTIALCLSLIYHDPWAPVAEWLAAYRVYDIITYRLYFLFVKSQERPWTRELLRRSVLIVLINFFEITIAYSILYMTAGKVQYTAGGPLSSSIAALYYSFLTMTTVGYGDFVPSNDFTRFLAITQVSATLLLLIFVVPALVSLLTTEVIAAQDSKEQ